MAAVDYWSVAREEAQKGRTRFMLSLMPWVGLFLALGLLSLAPPQNWDPAVVGFSAFLAGVLVVLMCVDGYKRYNRYYQAHVLPNMLAHHTPLHCDPLGSVSMLALAPAGVLPGADHYKTGSYLRGEVEGHYVEVSALDLSRDKIVRKVRKVKEPVFRGAVFAFDLGGPVLPTDMHIFGSRARRTREMRKMKRGLHRMFSRGTGFGVRVWGGAGASGVMTPEVRLAIKELMRLVPHARIGLYGGRHMIVAVPYFNRFFRPAGLFVTPRRDPHMGRVLAVFSAVTKLGVTLGAQPLRVYRRDGSVMAGSPVVSPDGVSAGPVSKKKALDLSGAIDTDWLSTSMRHGFHAAMFGAGRLYGRLAPVRSRSSGFFRSVSREGLKTARDLGQMVAHTNFGERMLERVDQLKKKDSPVDEGKDLDTMRRFAQRDKD